MTEQSKRNILIISVCIIFYIGLFPVRLGLEPLISRDWVIPSSAVAALPPVSQADKAYPVFSGRSLFYLEENGRRASPVTDASELSVGDNRFAQKLPSGQTGIFGRGGNLLVTIPQSGMPYLSERTLCILANTGNALSVYTDSGDFRWHFETDDVISGFCVGSKGDSFISLTNGRIFWMDSQGKIRATIIPGHGKHHVVYGILWIESRHELAAIVDVQPQSLLLLKPVMKKDSSNPHFEEIKDILIPQESRHPVVLQTELKDAFLLLEQPQGIGVISLEGNESRIVSLDGTVQKLVGINDAGILVAAAEYDSGASVLGFKADGRFLFRQRIRGRIDDVAVDQHDRLVISSGAGILALDFYIK